MSNKYGIIEKLKLCIFFITEKSRKNILTVNCELCGSTNIIRINSSSQDKSDDKKDIKTYQADYLCMDCKSECHCSQTWKRYNKKTIEDIRNKLKQS